MYMMSMHANKWRVIGSRREVRGRGRSASAEPMSSPCIRHGSAEWMPCRFASRQGVNQLLLVRGDGQCPSRGWRGRSCVDRVRGGIRVRFTNNMYSAALGGQYGLRGHTCARHPPSRVTPTSNQSTHSPKHPLQVTNTHTPRSTALKVINCFCLQS